ncbi:MAG: hypothetical protein NTY77_05625 [Elusimicrobia bacterium]|nr:hypothetical protein [Elusimicrobiota bacterium]
MSVKKPRMYGDLSQLDSLAASLNALRGRYRIRVGIFGDKNSRKKGALTNAEIGAVHEYGSVERKIPQRSFLKTPLIMKGEEFIGREIREKHLKDLMYRDVVGFCKRLGKAAENVVDAAFQTGCWGFWPQLKYRTLLGKLRGSLERRRQMAAEQIEEGASHASILIQSAQLRRAIASKVVGV